MGDVRGVDVADGKTYNLGTKPFNDLRQGLPVLLRIHIHNANRMALRYRTGHIIKPERVNRIRLSVRIGGNQQHSHCRPTSMAVTDLPNPTTRQFFPGKRTVLPPQKTPQAHSLVIFSAVESFHRCMRPGFSDSQRLSPRVRDYQSGPHNPFRS